MTISRVGGGAGFPSVSSADLKPVDAPKADSVEGSPNAVGIGADAFDGARRDYGNRLGFADDGKGGKDEVKADKATGSTGTQGSTGVQQVQAPALSADDKARLALIDHMGRGNNPPLSPDERKTFLVASRSLSMDQLKHADSSGLRLMRDDTAPPEFAKLPVGIAIPHLSEPAHYASGMRVLQFKSSADATQLTHELGHYRDDTLGEPANLKPVATVLAKVTDPAEQVKILDERGAYASLSANKTTYATQAPDDKGKLQPTKMTVHAMYEAYKERAKGILHQDQFHSPTQNNYYALKNAQEFFGEAFAVFHGGDPAMQAKLREEAPEMYYFLKADAKANGVPLPDEKAMDAALNAKP
ncbi:MAG: hypothetical protein QM723_26625 [Myxococcaceae bacterium]